MKVLFISAGSEDGGPKVVVRNQGESLIRKGAEVIFFCVRGKGIYNYIRSVSRLRKEIRDFQPDIIHAHYSFSGFLATLAGAHPLVVSLMGSDANSDFPLRMITRAFSKKSWDITIVKSMAMIEKLKLENAYVLPNGVNIDLFTLKDRSESIRRTGMDPTKRNILFPADPARPEKNFELSKKAIDILNDEAVRLIPVFNIPNKEMVWYYNAADVILMTSEWEGSPNVIKEAMACGLPVVSTDVGDVAELVEGIKGCSVCISDPLLIAGKIKEALTANRNSDARERIIYLGLDDSRIAEKLISLYLKLT